MPRTLRCYGGPLDGQALSVEDYGAPSPPPIIAETEDGSQVQYRVARYATPGATLIVEAYTCEAPEAFARRVFEDATRFLPGNLDRARALLAIGPPGGLPYEWTEALGLTDAECVQLSVETPYGFGTLRDGFPTPKEVHRRLALAMPEPRPSHSPRSEGSSGTSGPTRPAQSSAR